MSDEQPKEVEQFTSQEGGAGEGEYDEVWYRDAVARAPLLVLRVDAGGTICEANEAAAATLPEHLVGRSLPDVLRVCGGEDLGEAVMKAYHGATVTGVEACFIGRDGGERVYVLSCFPLLSVHGRAGSVVVVGTDITERAHREGTLRAAKEAAEAAMLLKSTILNSLSHEIRTPLTAILGFAELLYDEVGEPHREFVELIRLSGKRLMGTLISVLELARIESGDVRFEEEVLPLEQEVREAIRLLGPLAERKHLRLTMDGTAPEVLVRADRTALNRIINNLVTNAIKFTEQGGVEVTVRAAGGEAMLGVRDTGIGMSETFLPQLFGEFKQETGQFAPHPEGAGLGLAITKRLVDEMGGRITVESVKGQGSVFTVYLPSVDAP